MWDVAKSLQQHHEEPASGFTLSGFFFFYLHIVRYLTLFFGLAGLQRRGSGEPTTEESIQVQDTRLPLYVCSLIPVFSGCIANALLIPQNSVQLWPMLSLDWPHVGKVQGVVGWNPASNSEGREGSFVRMVQGSGGLWGATGSGGVIASLQGQLGFGWFWWRPTRYTV